MRPTKFPLVLLLSLVLTILCIHSTARADDETEGDEYDVRRARSADQSYSVATSV